MDSGDPFGGGAYSSDGASDAPIPALPHARAESDYGGDAYAADQMQFDAAAYGTDIESISPAPPKDAPGYTSDLYASDGEDDEFSGGETAKFPPSLASAAYWPGGEPAAG